MARIRSVKPDLRTSAVVASWPREVRYAFVLLWGYLDDYGRGLDVPKGIAGDLFPRDNDVTPAKMDGWLRRMTVGLGGKPGPLCRYEVDGIRYLHCVNWSEHQRVQRPTASKVPPCPLHESSGEVPEQAPEPSTKDSGTAQEFPLPGDGDGDVDRDGRTPSESETRATARDRRGSRLPDDFEPTQQMIGWARQNAPTTGRSDHETFCDYWRAQPGAKGRKVDWEATWRNWMRREHERRAGNGTRASPTPSTTDARVQAGLALAARFDAADPARKEITG